MKKLLLALVCTVLMLFSCTKTPSEIGGTKWKYVEHPKGSTVTFYLEFSPVGTGIYKITSITPPSKKEETLIKYNIDSYNYDGKHLTFTCANEKGETFTMNYKAEKKQLMYLNYDKDYTLQGFQLVPYYTLME